MSASLTGVHPELVAKIERVLAAMAALGFPMLVVQAVRTTEQQQALYAKGRTAPGRIVTNCDGVRKRSNHQAHEDGYGHAVDCAFVDDPLTAKIETWDEHQPWDLYGLMGETLGLTWGGRWRSVVDRPHLELPE